MAHHLPPHVYLALTGTGAVLLDLRRDRYFGLTIAQGGSLARLLGLAMSEPSTEGAGNELDLRLGAELESLGLLTLTPSCARRPLVQLPQANAPLIDPAATEPVRIAPGDAWNFALALVKALLLVRWWNLETLVRRQAKVREKPAPPISNERLGELMRVFVRLRACSYTKKGRCLLDSLVLLEFLERYSIRPLLVIGVKTQPFSAHSWVQHECYVLNGTPEFVRLYTPILAV